MLGFDELAAHRIRYEALWHIFQPIREVDVHARKVSHLSDWDHRPMELAFVLARRQNHFFVETVAAIRDELDQIGMASSMHVGSFPAERDDLVYVLVPPHEWFSLEARRSPPTTNQLARSIFICAEQPGTAFFEDDVRLAPFAGGVFDINAGSIREFRHRGVGGVRPLRLGWTRTWAHAPLAADGMPDPEPERDIDALHLGIFSGRRSIPLAAAAPWLSQWRCHLILGDPEGPNTKHAAGYASGATKWDLLTRSKALLNVHVSDRPYFEWMRAVQAISCGCVVVSEHSLGADPLVPGEHFLATRPEALGLVAHGLLSDEVLRALISRRAYDFLRTELPFSASVADLVETAGEIVARRRREGPRKPQQLPELLVAPAPEDDAPVGPRTPYPSVVADAESSALRAALKDVRLDLLQLRRDFARRRWEGAVDRVPAVAVDLASRGYRLARPRVTVITPLYNYEHHIESALDSVARGRYQDVEIVVVDDGSTDASLDAARRFVRAHDGLAVLLVAHACNRGLGAARNTALDFARGEFAFMLDADNELFPSGLGRLVEVLESTSQAAAAYGMLDMVSGEAHVGLLSCFPWDPERFRRGNFIDAMALWRTSVLRGLGGYTRDDRLYGLEDYDLWCRLAESGGAAELVPEVVARYRASRTSMLSLTNISARNAVAVLIERYPRLFAGVDPPL